MSAPIFQGDILFYQRLLKASGYYNDTLDGRWGTNTEAADIAFAADAAGLQARLGTFDTRSEKNIATLHIKAQELARQFMRAVANFEVTVRIISGARSYAEQDVLFAQGRTTPGRIVTNAEGGESNHNFAIAWDIGLFDGGEYLDGDTPRERRLYADASRLRPPNLEWGGDWTNPDTPHYQLPTGLVIREVRGRFERGQAYV